MLLQQLVRPASPVPSAYSRRGPTVPKGRRVGSVWISVLTLRAYRKGAALLGHGARRVVLVAQIVDATVRRAITERASKRLRRDYCSLKLIAREKNRNI